MYSQCSLVIYSTVGHSLQANPVLFLDTISRLPFPSPSSFPFPFHSRLPQSQYSHRHPGPPAAEGPRQDPGRTHKHHPRLRLRHLRRDTPDKGPSGSTERHHRPAAHCGRRVVQLPQGNNRGGHRHCTSRDEEQSIRDVTGMVSKVENSFFLTRTHTLTQSHTVVLPKYPLPLVLPGTRLRQSAWRHQRA